MEDASSKCDRDLQPYDPKAQLLMNKIRSSFFDFLKLCALFLAGSIECCLILYKMRSIYHLLPLSCLLALFTLEHWISRPMPVYLVDFSCFKPPKRFRVPKSFFLEHATLINRFDKGSIDFMDKVMDASGQGEETYFPPTLHYLPPRTGQQDTIKEAQMLLFPVMENLFSKTKISPFDIDILVVNCSGFCPSPSLSAMIVNRFAMRHDVKSFSLSGMGCSAGSIGVDVARNLLQIHPNSYAVVVSAEMLSTGWYAGKDRRKLLLNCTFRNGSSAVLLTNKKEAKQTSKYKICKLVRTQTATDDRSYHAGIREEDEDGITGFSVNEHLVWAIREAVRKNITAFAASVLPVSEKIRYLVSLLRKDSFVPNFGRVVDHYCIPASGLKFVKEISKALGLKKEETEAAMVTLHRFGNQSAASMWYQLAYMEGKGRVKKGDRVWQLWLGSGFKCCSIVWECMRSMEEEWKKGPWFDCIDRYPIQDENDP